MFGIAKLLFFLPIAIATIVSHQSPQDYYTHTRNSTVHGAGLGLFAKRLIPRGTEWSIASVHNTLFINSAVLSSLKDTRNDSEQAKAFYETILQYSYCDPFSNTLVLIMDRGRYVNHSDEPNSILSKERPYTSVAFRDIHDGEEIFENYHTLYNRTCTAVK
jgi:SET domain-containing protein